MTKRHLSFNTGSILALAAIFILGLSGCASTPDEDSADAGSDTGSEFSDAGATAGGEDGNAGGSAGGAGASIDPVYFDFDRSDIRADALPALKDAAGQLGESGQRLVISGHCDERGSEEYNLALGERRAASVRRHLANLGVPMQQLSIVSYGEVRPAAKGSSESAWAMNRRAEFGSAN